MSIAAIVRRGFGSGAENLPVRGYLATGAPPAPVPVVVEPPLGGKKKKQRKLWPTEFDDGYEPPVETKPKLISKIVTQKQLADEELRQIEIQLKQVQAERQTLLAQLRQARQSEEATIVGIAKIAELRHARALLDAEIDRIKQQQKKRKRILQELARIRAEQEEEDLRVIAFIINNLYD